MIKRLIFITICFLLIVFGVEGYRYYQQNETEIWLQIESSIAAVTLPFKIAELGMQDPVTEIPVPVYGVRLSEIADTWGAPRPTGRGHNGVDIFAETGTPVFAATPGYVIRIGENNLGGNTVFTIGPGGIRYYYAHLDRPSSFLSIGQEVTTDTIVGYVGNTGNAAQTPPHLHFGVYNNGSENPYLFLVDRP